MIIAGFLLSLLSLNHKDMSKINTLEEIWKPIPEYEGYYEASSLGRIKSLARTISQRNNGKRFIAEQIITPKSQGKYMFVVLSKCGIRKQFYIHRIIAGMFCENPLFKQYVNHKDGNKLNNLADNLEWVTHLENVSHATLTGLVPSGKRHKFTKPIIQLTLSGEFVAEHINSQFAAKAVSGDSGNIRRVCIGTSYYAYGFKWKYKNASDVGKVFQSRYLNTQTT